MHEMKCKNCGIGLFRLVQLNQDGDMNAIFEEDAKKEQGIRHYDQSKGQEYYLCPNPTCGKKNWLATEDHKAEGKGLKAYIYMVTD